jgi:CHAT domain-containing protein
LSADERNRRDELHGKIQNAERAYRSVKGLEKTSSLAEQAELRRQLAELIRSHEGTEAAVTAPLDRVASFLKQGRVVVAPVETDAGGMVFVATVRDGAVRLAGFESENLNFRKVAEFVRGPTQKELGGWFGAYQANYVSHLAGRQKWQAWLAAIDGLGADLWNLVGRPITQALAAVGAEPGTELIIVPQGALGVLPIGLAQDPKSGRRLIDDYVVTYAPSLAAIATISERLQMLRADEAATLAAVINPTSDLRFSAIEGALIESRFAQGARAVLEGDAATIHSILKAIDGRSYWHFASHGSFNWMDSSAAGLLLKKEVLSVAALSGALALGTPRLVVLSACETGLHEMVRTPDEFSGLPAAFLRIGAIGVLSTLWPVNDVSTAFLVVLRLSQDTISAASSRAAARAGLDQTRQPAGSARLREDRRKGGARISSVGNATGAVARPAKRRGQRTRGIRATENGRIRPRSQDKPERQLIPRQQRDKPVSIPYHTRRHAADSRPRAPFCAPVLLGRVCPYG